MKVRLVFQYDDDWRPKKERKKKNCEGRVKTPLLVIERSLRRGRLWWK